MENDGDACEPHRFPQKEGTKFGENRGHEADAQTGDLLPGVHVGVCVSVHFVVSEEARNIVFLTVTNQSGH